MSPTLSAAQLLAAYYEPEGVASAIILLMPIVVAIASFWPSARGHWSGPALALLPLLVGLAFVMALARDGPGFAGWFGVFFFPLPLILGLASLELWIRRRDRRDDSS